MKEISIRKRTEDVNSHSLHLIIFGHPIMDITTHIFRDAHGSLLVSIRGFNNDIDTPPLPFHMVLYKLIDLPSNESMRPLAYEYKNIINEITKFIMETTDKDTRNYYDSIHKHIEEIKKKHQIIKNKKYTFTGKRELIDNNIVLFQIKAVKDFDNIKAGDIGGWIESDKNLSHIGNCWIDKNARVYGDVNISGDIYIENSTINGSQVNLKTVESMYPTKLHHIINSNISGNDITISNSDIIASQIIGNHIDISNCGISHKLIEHHPMGPPVKMKLAHINISEDYGNIRDLPGITI